MLCGASSVGAGQISAEFFRLCLRLVSLGTDPPAARTGRSRLHFTAALVTDLAGAVRLVSLGTDPPAARTGRSRLHSLYMALKRIHV